jgi:hypothetical protein
MKTDKAAVAYMLRTCNADMIAHNGFKWPESGPVECTDWDPKPQCGNGLHGLLNGEGEGLLLNWDHAAKWLVVEVLASEVVAIDNAKVKVPRGVVLFAGDRMGATDLIATLCPASRAIVGYTATAGYGGTATAGARGTATAGYDGTATAGYGGTATAGARGTATAGYDGTATAGVDGTATAGVGGTATAGARGTATAGYGGTATAGYGGVLNIRWYDGTRYRIATFYIGENGIKPNVAYKCESGKAIKVSK